MSPSELACYGDSAFLGPIWFAVYRLLVALYAVALWFWCWSWYIVREKTGYFFIYLTYWSLSIEVVYLVLSAIISIRIKTTRLNINTSDKHVKIPHLVFTSWILMNLIYVVSLVVFLLYWGLVFNGTTSATTAQAHGVNFLLMLIDVFLSGAPYRILHFYVPVMYSVVYLIFNAVYVMSGGVNETGSHYVYSSIDWMHNPTFSAVLAVVITLVVIPFLHMLLWFWWKFGNFCTGETQSWKEKVLDGLQFQVDTTVISIPEETKRMDEQTLRHNSHYVAHAI